MKPFVTSLIVLIASMAHADTCKYGLGYTYGTESCSSREAEALGRVAAAKTVCISANSEVQWNKNSKEPTWAWAAIHAGEFAAVKGFTLEACEHADLVVKYVYDDMSETVKFNVTEAESSATVFEETRSVSDLHSDAVRMANHWHEMVVDARAAARTAKAAAEEAERQREQQARLEEKSRQCQAQFDSLKQNIISYIEVQHAPLPQIVLSQIAAHNDSCTNQISPEMVQQQEKAEADAKLAQEEAAKEKALKEKRAGVIGEREDRCPRSVEATGRLSFVCPACRRLDACRRPSECSLLHRSAGCRTHF